MILKIALEKAKSKNLDLDKTKISVRFRGREILNSNLGLRSIKKDLKDEFKDIAQVDQELKIHVLEGETVILA